MAEHLDHAGSHVVEVWHGGEFICAVYGADGPGIRVITKHHVLVSQTSMITELTIVKDTHETPTTDKT